MITRAAKLVRGLPFKCCTGGRGETIAAMRLIISVEGPKCIGFRYKEAQPPASTSEEREERGFTSGLVGGPFGSSLLLHRLSPFPCHAKSPWGALLLETPRRGAQIMRFEQDAPFGAKQVRTGSSWQYPSAEPARPQTRSLGARSGKSSSLQRHRLPASLRALGHLVHAGRTTAMILGHYAALLVRRLPALSPCPQTLNLKATSHPLCPWPPRLPQSCLTPNRPPSLHTATVI